jgi:hypothetical protein
MLQAIAMFIERSEIGRTLRFSAGLRGRLFTLNALLLPLPFLYPPPFIHGVAGPFLAALHTIDWSHAASTWAPAMRATLPYLIFVAGIGQLGLLVAAALLPFRLKWRETFASLPRLHRQMSWVYPGYVVLSFVAFGLMSIFESAELAGGSSLARAVCLYIAVFWAIRLSLQPVFDVKPFITTWWLRWGYRTLTVLFVYFTAVYAAAALL